MLDNEMLSRAVIPTNSLILIEEEGSPLIDPLIVYLRASCSIGNPTIKKKPHEYVTIYKTSSIKAGVKFRRGKSKRELNLASVIEILRRYGFGDAWVHNITLRVKDQSNMVWDLNFRNSSLTEGSKASLWVSNYLEGLKQDGWIEKVQIRHLPLVSVRSVPEGANMSPYDLSDPSFIAWLGEITNGLIRLKTMRKIDETTFIDVDIKEALR